MNTHEKIKIWECSAGDALLGGLNLSDHPQILDYGCGFGHYTIAMANYLGDNGIIFAVDVNNECFNNIRNSIQEQGLRNVQVQTGNEDYTLKFHDESLDMILYYDILHGRGVHKTILIEEAKRVLKNNDILSILPFHLTNFRDKQGNKKKYTYKMIVEEVCEYGFDVVNEEPKTGIHFEKYHSPYYIRKGGVEFDDLERVEIINFIKI